MFNLLKQLTVKTSNTFNELENSLIKADKAMIKLEADVARKLEAQRAKNKLLKI